MRNQRKVSVILILLVVILTFLLWQYDVTDSVFDYLSHSIEITSFIIAIIALIVALTTYFTIDSVNNISSMAGNVLENSNYAVEPSLLVKEYSAAKTPEEFRKKLLRDMNKFVKKHNKTCMEFADSIQYVIDRLIWLAYIDRSDYKYAKEKKKLLKRIEKKNKRHCKLSNGMQYTLNENIKLIKYVMQYQQNADSDDYKTSNIADIRGRMIQNPVSKIIYYDYLGLDYRKQAKMLLNVSGTAANEFSVENMTKIKEHSYKIEELDKIKLLLGIAEDAFYKAEKYAEGDILWEGYIKYNLVRILIVYFLIEDEKIQGEQLLEKLEEVINARMRVCLIYKNKEGYLATKLQEELNSAKALYSNVSNFIIKEQEQQVF